MRKSSGKKVVNGCVCVRRWAVAIIVSESEKCDKETDTTRRIHSHTAHQMKKKKVEWATKTHRNTHSHRTQHEHEKEILFLLFRTFYLSSERRRFVLPSRGKCTGEGKKERQRFALKSHSLGHYAAMDLHKSFRFDFILFFSILHARSRGDWQRREGRREKTQRKREHIRNKHRQRHTARFNSMPHGRQSCVEGYFLWPLQLLASDKNVHHVMWCSFHDGDLN